MTEAAGAARFVDRPDSRPAFTRYARLHEDRARGRTVILAPERAYELDPIGLIVLSRDRRRNARRRSLRAPRAAIRRAARRHHSAT